MFRPPLTNNNDLTTSLRDLTNDIQLHPDYVNPVASGGFSDIYRAKLGDIDVAVKRLRHVFSTDPLAAKRVGGVLTLYSTRVYIELAVVEPSRNLCAK